MKSKVLFMIFFSIFAGLGAWTLPVSADPGYDDTKDQATAEKPAASAATPAKKPGMLATAAQKAKELAAAATEKWQQVKSNYCNGSTGASIEDRQTVCKSSEPVAMPKPRPAPDARPGAGSEVTPLTAADVKKTDRMAKEGDASPTQEDANAAKGPHDKEGTGTSTASKTSGSDPSQTSSDSEGQAATAGGSNSGSSGGGVSQDSQVSSSARSQAEACYSLGSSAQNSCQQGNDMVSQLTQQIIGLLAVMNSNSAAANCSQTAQATNNAASQMNSQANACSQATSNCQSVCNDALTRLKGLENSAAYVRAAEGMAACRNGGSTNSNMAMNLAQMLSASKQSSQCVQQITAADCANAQFAANNLTCICQVNPGDQRCGGKGSFEGLGTVAAAKAAKESTGQATDVNALADANAALVPKEISRHGQFQQQKGRGGSGIGSGGGGDGAANGKAGGLVFGKASTISLGSGSGSGGSWANDGGGRSRAASGGGYPEATRTMGQGGLGQGKASQFVDLRKFLPRGASSDANRLARGPSSLDTLGSRHTNIFTTINQRYFRVKESLSP